MEILLNFIVLLRTVNFMGLCLYDTYINFRTWSCQCQMLSNSEGDSTLYDDR